MLDRDFRTMAKLNTASVDRTQDDFLLSFPIEKARIRSFFYPCVTAIVTIVGYGWSLKFRTHLALPLSLQFVIGGGLQCCFTTLNTLLLDLHPQNPSTAQAACNLVRCGLAAAGIALTNVLIQHIDVGWYFTLLAASVMSCIPLLIIERNKGLRWRQEKADVVSLQQITH